MFLFFLRYEGGKEVLTYVVLIPGKGYLNTDEKRSNINTVAGVENRRHGGVSVKFIRLKKR